MPQKKKKIKIYIYIYIFGGIINCDLYFSPTGIKNFIKNNKIKKKKKKKKKKHLRRLSNLGPFLEVVVEKKTEEKKTLDRITEVFHFQYVRDFGITVNMETKPK